MFDFRVIDDVADDENVSEKKRYLLSVARQFYDESARLFALAESYKRQAKRIK